MNGPIGKAVEDRITEGGTGRGRAALAAAIIGVGAAVTAYKALRG